MELEDIRKLVAEWIEASKNDRIPPHYATDIIQCQLLLMLLDKMSDVESYLKSIDNEIWVRGTGKD